MPRMILSLVPASALHPGSVGWRGRGFSSVAADEPRNWPRTGMGAVPTVSSCSIESEPICRGGPARGGARPVWLDRLHNHDDKFRPGGVALGLMHTRSRPG